MGLRGQGLFNAKGAKSSKEEEESIWKRTRGERGQRGRAEKDKGLDGRARELAQGRIQSQLSLAPLSLFSLCPLCASAPLWRDFSFFSSFELFAVFALKLFCFSPCSP